MNTAQNTFYIQSNPAHLAEAIIPFLKNAIPGLVVCDDKNAFLRLTLDNGAITLYPPKSKKGDAIATPVKIAVLIQQIKKTYLQYRPVHIGPYIFDYRARTLNDQGKILHLTEKEAEVLTYLDQHRGQGVTRDDLLKNVWGYAEGIDTHTIETHIYRLRQKIEKNTVEAKILLTHDDGYQLVENN